MPSPNRPAPSRRTVLGAATLLAAPLPALALPAATAAAAPLGPAATASAGGGSLAFVQPGTSRTLHGLSDVEVSAPDGTTAVRFSLGGIAFAELTDLYARGTGTAPLWRTATDASWFPAGPQVLRAEADTPAGVVRAELPVTVAAHESPAGRTVLNGGWRVAVAGELPAGALEGDHPAACLPEFDDSALPLVIVPSSLGAIRAKWNPAGGVLAVHRRTLTVKAPSKDERLLLTFASGYFAMRVFINGTLAGTAAGGYLPEVFDITALVKDGTNTLAVTTDNRTGALFPLNPALYWNYGGLFAGVHLDRTPSVALTGLTATGAADGRVTLYAAGVNTSGSTRLIRARLEVQSPDGSRLPPKDVEFSLPAQGAQSAAAPVTVSVAGSAGPQVWDLDHPRLYTLRLTPTNGTGHPLSTRTGLRDIRVDGTKILLNGQEITGLRGFNRHADYPGLGRTQPDELARRELTQLHRRGYRIYRPAHYPATPAELDTADELGLLVFEEINVTQRFNADQLTSPAMISFAKERLTKLIARDRSHPSVFAWSVGNENGTETAKGADYVRQLITYGKSLDATRLFTHVTGWGAADEGFGFDDFVGVNIYDGWYYNSFATLTDPAGGDYSIPVIRKKAGTKPVLLTEYGAEAVTTYPGEGKGTEHYQALMVDEYNRLLDQLGDVPARMYWTSTEFALNPSGGGGNPKPVPGFHNKGIQTYWREPKLAWRVMFAPVRIDEVPALPAPADATTDVPFRLTLRTTGAQAATGTLKLTAPAGCVVEPASAPVTVKPGEATTVSAVLRGTPARGAAPGLAQVTFGTQTEAQPRLLRVNVPYGSLAAAFSGTGITDDGATDVSDFTGSGRSYSAQALAAAGLKPGGTFTHEGTVFHWPDVPAGAPDNVPATGQLIRLDASGTSLALLAAATYGTQGGTGTVHYSDGTSAPYTLRVDDWYATSSSTDARAAAVLPYHNGPSGRISQPVTLWRTDIPLRAGATVKSVELPATGTPPGGCVHVFALTLT